MNSRRRRRDSVCRRAADQGDLADNRHVAAAGGGTARMIATCGRRSVGWDNLSLLRMAGRHFLVHPPHFLAGSQQWGLRVIWPWQDRGHRFSWLKASVLALMFVPPSWLLFQVVTEQFGPVPLGGITCWSGFWATALLMLIVRIACGEAKAVFRRAGRILYIDHYGRIGHAWLLHDDPRPKISSVRSTRLSHVKPPPVTGDILPRRSWQTCG